MLSAERGELVESGIQFLRRAVTAARISKYRIPPFNCSRMSISWFLTPMVFPAAYTPELCVPGTATS